MKINKLLTPVIGLATLSSVVVPLTSCSGQTETQKTFSFGNNRLYTPKKAAMEKMTGKSYTDIVKAWAKAIKDDPNIFYDDIHYAIDREWYVDDTSKDLYTTLPQGRLNFKWFEVNTEKYTLSFELEYSYKLQYNKDKPILGPNWNKIELEGRIDFFDIPLIDGSILLGSSLGGNGDTIPYYAVKLTDDGIKNKAWYIHAIELGYVYDKDGNQYESAHNGWISGYSTDSYKPHGYSLGYFINYAPFIYDKGNPGSLVPHINLSNYYLKNNVPAPDAQ